MKKATLLLLLALVVVFVSACGSEQVQPLATTMPVVEPTTTTAPSLEPTAEPTAEPITETADLAQAGELPAEIVAQLDAYLQSQVWTEGGNPANAAPGLVLLVDTPEGRYLGAAGVSSLEAGTPMQVDDILEIGSNTKSMVIVLLMELVEEGVLSLDDLLSDWLPEQAAIVPNSDQISLRQMAQHTAGIHDYEEGITSDPAGLQAAYTPAEIVQFAMDEGEPDFSPGEQGQWKYSNTGYILLGMIIEAATGESLSDLLQSRIFDPLGLESAVLIEGVPQEGEITARGYQWTEEGERLDTTDWNASQAWAAGAVAMTAEDLATYGKALAAGELFQNEDSLAQMLDFDQGALNVLGAPYGLGLIDFGDGYWGHEGQTLGFQSLWYTNPEEGTTVVGLTNSATYSGFSFLQVRNILQGEGVKPFTAGSLLPLADVQPSFVPSVWRWVELAAVDGAQEIEPGTVLILLADNSATAASRECGAAPGTFAAGPEGTLSLELDTAGVTCSGEEDLVRLLGLLESADTWHFENGRLVIVLENGQSLLFDE